MDEHCSKKRMDEKSENYVREVAELLSRGELYLVAGAGISNRAGIPCWEDLLKEFSEAYNRQEGKSIGRAKGIEMLAETKNLDLFELMLNDKQGEIAFIEVLKKYFDNQRYNEIHRKLLELPFRGIVTFNYDTCFENACRRESMRTELLEKRWFCFPRYRSREMDVGKMCDGSRFLLHLHGCFRYDCEGVVGKYELENIVLTRSQYMKFYKEKTMDEIIEWLVVKDILFLGTSLTDRYFLDRIAPSRKPKGPNERANSSKWYKLCSSEREHCDMFDEEQYVMYNIHYKEENDGFLRAVNAIAELTDVDRGGVDKLVVPGSVVVRESI